MQVTMRNGKYGVRAEIHVKEKSELEQVEYEVFSYLVRGVEVGNFFVNAHAHSKISLFTGDVTDINGPVGFNKKDIEVMYLIPEPLRG